MKRKIKSKHYKVQEQRRAARGEIYKSRTRKESHKRGPTSSRTDVEKCTRLQGRRRKGNHHDRKIYKLHVMAELDHSLQQQRNGERLG
jgi:hypothetical protein